MRKCINCKWIGEEALRRTFHCPICGDETVLVGKEVVVPAGVLDLNKDGKVDVKDVKTFAKRVSKAVKRSVTPKKKRGRR